MTSGRYFESNTVILEQKLTKDSIKAFLWHLKLTLFLSEAEFPLCEF